MSIRARVERVHRDWSLIVELVVLNGDYDEEKNNDGGEEDVRFGGHLTRHDTFFKI